MKIYIVLALIITCVSAASLYVIVQPGFASERIINGFEAHKGEAPYIVSLKSGEHFCAGSIIDENWVVTAAHCLIYNSFEIVAGLHSRNDESEVQIRQVNSKSQYIIHEGYGGGVSPNDIGLIHIPDGFDFSARTRDGVAAVGKASLPSGKYEITGAGRLYGWGFDNSENLANILQTLEVNIIGYTECKAALPFLAPIKDVNICSYKAGTTDGACSGDSGGSLVRYNAEGAEVVGIVSWVYDPCAITKYPSIYTNVSVYVDWILENTSSYRISSHCADLGATDHYA
ncbi:lectizyme-like [Eurosta solidaginis]|uniref:lectizyme-like n=1 Tax=Eurosta solidaginis TaxID=178769 RepID=UPI003530A4C9